MRIEWRVNEIASCIVMSFVAANRFSPASNVARAWHALSRRCVCAAPLTGKREWRTRFAANIGDARHAFVDCVNTETNDEPVISLRRVASRSRARSCAASRRLPKRSAAIRRNAAPFTQSSPRVVSNRAISSACFASGERLGQPTHWLTGRYRSSRRRLLRDTLVCRTEFVRIRNVIRRYRMSRCDPHHQKIGASHLIELRKIIRRSCYLFDPSSRIRIASKVAHRVSTRPARAAL